MEMYGEGQQIFKVLYSGLEERFLTTFIPSRRVFESHTRKSALLLPARGALALQTEYNKFRSIKRSLRIAYIYVIKNDINDKVYVGKTNLEIKQRFKQHIRDSSRREKENRPLYRAMMKYGSNHFSIHELEKVTAEEASEREQYWINYYNSYHNGYNVTLGGDGKSYLDYQEILRLCDETLLPQEEIARKCNCCTDSVRNIARQYRPNINWHMRLVEQQISQGITTFASTPVRCIETQEVFVSCTEAGKWLVEQGKITSIKCGKNHISDVCQGNRKTVGGYHWEYVK